MVKGDYEAQLKYMRDYYYAHREERLKYSREYYAAKRDGLLCGRETKAARLARKARQAKVVARMVDLIITYGLRTNDYY